MILIFLFVSACRESASAGGSDDDEGSNAATEGSTLRTSPAEPAGSGAGSESGGSGFESIGGTSGRSSTYGEQQLAGNAVAATVAAASAIGSAVGGNETTATAAAALVKQTVHEEDADEVTEKEYTHQLRVLR